MYIYIYMLTDHNRELPEGLLFNSYFTEVLARVLLFFLDCYTYP